MANHQRTVEVLVDAADAGLDAALAAAFVPHPTRSATASTTGEAVRAVADAAAVVVVVAPPAIPPTAPQKAPPTASPTDRAADDLHDLLALRVWRWVEAAQVVGARVVLVSRDDVFAPTQVPDGRCDEFATTDASDPVGRARRAGEAAIRTGPHAVVRAGVDDSPEAIAELVRWAARSVRPGTWHLPAGTSPILDARHTRLVRATIDGPAPPPDPS